MHISCNRALAMNVEISETSRTTTKKEDTHLPESNVVNESKENELRHITIERVIKSNHVEKKHNSELSADVCRRTNKRMPFFY